MAVFIDYNQLHALWFQIVHPTPYIGKPAIEQAGIAKAATTLYLIRRRQGVYGQRQRQQIRLRKEV